MNKLERGLTIHVNYADLIRSHNGDNIYDPGFYISCKLCGGTSDKETKNRGIHHIGDCAVGRWELRKVIREHKRHTYVGYAGGYHHSVWPNCGAEMQAENKRREKTGLPPFEWEDRIVNNPLNY